MLSWNCNGGLRRKLKDTQLNKYFCKFEMVFLCEVKKVEHIGNTTGVTTVERNSNYVNTFWSLNWVG